MEATFGDSKAQHDELDGKQIEEADSRRIKENEDRRSQGEKTIGGSAGRAQVANKDPEVHDTRRGGQGDRLPNEKPVI